MLGASMLGVSTLGALEAAGQDVQNLPKQKPFSIRGSLAAGLTYYHAEGISGRRQPFS